MAAIRFPGSVGIGSSNSSRTDGGRHHNHEIRRVVRTERGNDVIQISAEAKKRYEQGNLVKLEKVRLMKEARAAAGALDKELKFREADLRNVYRLHKISGARLGLAYGYYRENEDSVIKNLLQKALY